MADIRQQYGGDSAGPLGGALNDEDAATQASTAQLKKTENRLELAFEVCGSWPEDTMNQGQFRKARTAACAPNALSRRASRHAEALRTPAHRAPRRSV